MTLYGFFYTDCIYESAFALHSLHFSKTGAWRAMREEMNRLAAYERDMALQHGKVYMRQKPLWMEGFKVQPVEVKD